MSGTKLDNINPSVFECKPRRPAKESDWDNDVVDKFDEQEIFDLVRDINDPEHPLTLEQLNVIEETNITVDDDGNYIKVNFTPTIPHCSMATIIGLAIRVQLMRSLPPRFKMDICISPGSHVSEDAINKQLGDKERVAAALENSHLLDVINKCLTPNK